MKPTGHPPKSTTSMLTAPEPLSTTAPKAQPSAIGLVTLFPKCASAPLRVARVTSSVAQALSKPSSASWHCKGVGFHQTFLSQIQIWSVNSTLFRPPPIHLCAASFPTPSDSAVPTPLLPFNIPTSNPYEPPPPHRRLGCCLACWMDKQRPLQCCAGPARPSRFPRTSAP